MLTGVQSTGAMMESRFGGRSSVSTKAANLGEAEGACELGLFGGCVARCRWSCSCQVLNDQHRFALAHRPSHRSFGLITALVAMVAGEVLERKTNSSSSYRLSTMLACLEQRRAHLRDTN